MSPSDRSDVFRGIAHPLRRKVLCLLHEREASVTELLESCHVGMQTLSQHLAVLRETGLVSQRVSGPRRYYRLKPAALRRFGKWLSQFDA